MKETNKNLKNEIYKLIESQYVLLRKIVGKVFADLNNEYIHGNCGESDLRKLNDLKIAWCYRWRIILLANSDFGKRFSRQ